MGRQLYQHAPAFRAAIDECALALDPVLSYPLRDVLWGDAHGVLAHTRYTQPAMFALGYGLARQLGSWGVRPDAVMGHSVGEFAAAIRSQRKPEPYNGKGIKYAGETIIRKQGKATGG